METETKNTCKNTCKNTLKHPTTNTRKYPPHSPISFYLKLQALGLGFKIDEQVAVNDRISILDITGNRKEPEYMVYIDKKCKLPIRDEEAIIKLATTLCERKTPGNTYQFFIPAEEHAHIAEGTKAFYYTQKINPYQLGDMVIFYDNLHAGNYTKTLITYIQELEGAVIMNIKIMEVLSNEEKCC